MGPFRSVATSLCRPECVALVPQQLELLSLRRSVFIGGDIGVFCIQ